MEHVDAEYEVAFRHAQVKEDRKAMPRVSPTLVADIPDDFIDPDSGEVSQKYTA